MEVTQRGRRILSRWLAVLGVNLCACSAEPSPATPGGGGSMPIIGAPAAGGSMSAPWTPMAGATGASAGSGGQVVQAGSAAPLAGIGASAGTGAPVAPADVSFHKDIRPIIEGRCLGCHVDGGAGPFALDSYAKVQELGALVVAAVTSRRMPPWLADDADCTKLRFNQRLSDAQVALFTAWMDGGFAEGNPADFVALNEERVREVGAPTIVMKATQPVSLPRGREWYECVPKQTLSEDTWVTAIQVVPDKDEYVHHAIVNVGGGQCSALGILADNVYSFRPGSQRLVFEEGDAMLIPAGSRIAVQYHYNTRFAPGATSDQSELHLWTLPAGQKPQRAITRMPNHDMAISIPVGAVDQREGEPATITSSYAPAGAELIGISPHMHYLGQTFQETLRKRDGTEVCLVDIPDWNQDWQLDYFYNPADYIPVASGDVVRQTCTYSNRPEDQGRDPEGNLFTPQWTTYGEDTRQEMCLGYIWFRHPL
jgi:hypothetical protein